MTPSVVDHYMYFHAERPARALAKVLADRGWSVVVRESDPDWLLLASQHADGIEAIDAQTRELEALCAAEVGTYDGFERDVIQRR